MSPIAVNELRDLLGTFVVFERAIGDVYPNHGYVLDVSDQLLLVSVYDDDVFLDGYAVCRISDIVRIEEKRGFEVRALEALHVTPLPTPSIELSSWKTCIESVDKAFPLVTISTEEMYNNEVYIGKVCSLTNDSLELLQTTTDAEWWDDPTTYELKDITRVGFAGRYETALSSLLDTE